MAIVVRQNQIAADGDDYAGSTATTGVVSVGGSVSGNIESTQDTDWFRVTLTAGRLYQFDLEGSDTGQGTLADPFLRLMDGAGGQIAIDFDSGTGNNARITFAPTSSGTYFLSADGSISPGLGTYKLSVADLGAGGDEVLPVAGTLPFGDFNGDGKADILWQDDDSGTVGVWLMHPLAKR